MTTFPSSISLRVLKWIVSSLFICLLWACSASPKSSSDWQKSEGLWQLQTQAVSSSLEQNSAPRLWVLAAALHDQSKAFEGDISALQTAVQEIQPQAIFLSLSNPPPAAELNRPFATRENLQRALQYMGQHMRSGDHAVVMLSTHGNQRVLAVSAANRDYPLVTDQQLREWLVPLLPHPTGIIVSACYSGSLVPSLRAPKRWITTAAAADRNSFGCNFQSQQTYFIKALTQQLRQQPQTLTTWFAATVGDVQKMEASARLSPPSNPQLWVGPAMTVHMDKEFLKFWRP